MGWMDRALCRNADGDIWWPAPNAPVQSEKAIEVATAICSGCPVQKTCLEYAERLGATRGIWGGKNFFVSRPGTRKTAS